METVPQKRERPTLTQLDEEIKRIEKRKAYQKALRGTIWSLVVVAATAAVCANFFLSALRIQGNSMNPVLMDGDIVVALRTEKFSSGDIIAFYYNNKILLKRSIAGANEWVNIDPDGNVYVNDNLLNEPYVAEKSLGEHDIKLPYQVPDGRYFVLGDHRNVSADSRSSLIGTVSTDQVVGKVLFRVWPLTKIGAVG